MMGMRHSNESPEDFMVRVAAYFSETARGEYLGVAADISTLRAENERLREMFVHVYNSGYHAGHHDTVEGGFTDIHSSDMDTYHAEEVAELVEALRGEK